MFSYIIQQRKKILILSRGKDGVSNRLYRYELVEDKLVNPKKLLELPLNMTITEAHF